MSINSKSNNINSQDESLRLEAICCCVNFDDVLDFTLSANMAHLDTMIVVTSHSDRKTNMVAAKHGAICVPTDLFAKNERVFNKGAAINAGFNYFQYNGWRLHLDADIALPCSFRRILFNHTHLEKHCIYGADRFDVVGKANIEKLRQLWQQNPQHQGRFLMDPTHGHDPSIGAFGARGVPNLESYAPLGYFQLTHFSTQKEYPYSRGSCAHDDVMYSCLYPAAYRRLLPSVCVYHLCPEPPQWGQNWEGRKQIRLDSK